MEPKIWIILAAVLGTLVLALAVVLGLFCWKRSKRRMRGFSLRAVTPLDDAEFESWRRPSQYTQRPEKYGIRPTQPALIRSTRTPNMFEKELGISDPTRTPSPRQLTSTIKSPTSPIKKPERVRRKSSVSSSIADRPPTPYSPASTSSEYPRSSYNSRKSHSGAPYIHYPSMSEASAFNFNFDFESGSPPRDHVRPSTSTLSDRPLNLSYAQYSDKV
ncbi:hypothetical protein BS50DRAFT_582393 [Corynespora cassiicola Philippines]|uniref:Uncharacterized protein n=1 Tax=Corynespora cassiicola Philippines TaxID=1448308 RepID=A0A2T2P4Z4_CORCC|nr:hypothetical protein BS50DRAFT_582393 [Corynespora cassiicola Philippines]